MKTAFTEAFQPIFKRPGYSPRQSHMGAALPEGLL